MNHPLSTDGQYGARHKDLQKTNPPDLPMDSQNSRGKPERDSAKVITITS